MLSLLLLVIMASIVAGELNVNSTLTSVGSGSFEYLLAYSWTPGFCQSQKGMPGCSSPEDYWNTHFTLHGLWPQYTDQGYPSFCTKEAFDPAAPEAVGMNTMTTYWPNVKSTEGSSDYDDFWEHEWTKHGTCSTLTQQEYFQTAINQIESFGTPSIVTENVGSTVNADDLRNAFGGVKRVALKCENSKTLSGVFTCWSQSNGNPTAQVDCPNDVQGEDTCHDSTIDIISLN
jgi:ribonuclease T2